MKAIELEGLREMIGDDAIISHVTKNGTRCLVTYPDKSNCVCFFKNGGWRFAESNVDYQAGYAYACGYRD